ncbi:hypothetical protein EVAR_93292_1 [Eumeta japonica]|uniref:Uncharacterized protein n=1 Tax=Eumeta variegata TaxID=151549 RepID=A0A4C1USS7_EUMVA|nr:hypothetical protein EVAR_93292_1 [Eumeta japonica]
MEMMSRERANLFCGPSVTPLITVCPYELSLSFVTCRDKGSTLEILVYGKHVPLTRTDDSGTAQWPVNTAGGAVLPNQVSSNTFSPEPPHADEHYHVEE